MELNLPIVEGLGNLRGRLAFNNSHFLYAALLDVDRLANGFLITALLTQATLDIHAAVADRRRSYISAFLLALMLGPILQAAANPDLTSFSADYALIMLGIVLLQQLAHFLSLKNPSANDERFVTIQAEAG